MSATGPTATAQATIHPSWWAKAAAWVKHEAVVVKNVILKINSDMPEVAAKIAKVAPTVEGISNLIIPGSGSFEQHLLNVWGTVASAVDALGEAAAANGVSVSLDAELVAAIKAFIPAVKAEMSPNASATPAVPSAPPAALSSLVKS